MADYIFFITVSLNSFLVSFLFSFLLVLYRPCVTGITRDVGEKGGIMGGMEDTYLVVLGSLTKELFLHKVDACLGGQCWHWDEDGGITKEIRRKRKGDAGRM